MNFETYLQIANQVASIVKAVRDGRAEVTHNDGTVVTAADLEAGYTRLVAHAGQVGDDAIADIAARQREDGD